MPSFIKNLTFDCEDALRVARFWAAALVSDVDEESTSERLCRGTGLGRPEHLVPGWARTEKRTQQGPR